MKIIQYIWNRLKLFLLMSKPERIANINALKDECEKAYKIVKEFKLDDLDKAEVSIYTTMKYGLVQTIKAIDELKDFNKNI